MITDTLNIYNYPPQVIPQIPPIFNDQPDLSMYFDNVQDLPMYFDNTQDLPTYFDTVQDSSMFYPNGYISEEYPSPVMTELAREYVTRMTDTLYERQLLEPYGQFFQDQYFFNGYF